MSSIARPPLALSATLAADEILARRRAAGLPVLPMAFGEAGLPVHPALIEQLAAAAGRNGYGPVSGSAALREAAAGYWSRRGLATDPDLVVAGPGSKPLLFGLLPAIGGRIAVPVPSWVSYAAQVRLAGGEPVLVPTLPGEGGVPDPDRLAVAAAGDPELRTVIVTLPDNPTGTLARPETVRRVCEVARDLDLTIVSDEIYRDLVHDPVTPYLSPAEVAPERTVITSGLSKSLALGGWRIGVARLPDAALAARLRAVASEIWSSPPAPVQEAAAYAYAEPPELVERVTLSRRLHGEVAREVAARFRTAGLTVAEPRGGFYVYPDFGESGLAADTSRVLAEALLERFGLGVLPGSSFGDRPEALRMRVATSLLYGQTDEERLTALQSEAPAGLPWIAASLDRLSGILSELTAPAPQRVRRVLPRTLPAASQVAAAG